MLKDTRGRFMQGWQLMPLLGFKPGEHLPPEGFEPRVIQGATFKCLPANGGKHRIMALCHCGKWLPYGRMNQHAPACKAYQDADGPADTNSSPEFD